MVEPEEWIEDEARNEVRDARAATAAADDPSDDLQLGLDDARARRKSPQELGH